MSFAKYTITVKQTGSPAKNFIKNGGWMGGGEGEGKGKEKERVIHAI